MKSAVVRTAWGALIAATFGTLAVNHLLWASNWYVELRWFLALCSFASGIDVVAATWPNRKALLMVIAVLGIGQLWLLQAAFTRMTWSLNGFAQ